MINAVFVSFVFGLVIAVLILKSQRSENFDFRFKRYIEILDGFYSKAHEFPMSTIDASDQRDQKKESLPRKRTKAALSTKQPSKDGRRIGTRG